MCRIHVAVVTGCSPNHLDWHGSYADYVAAKQRILTWQTPEDFAVLNAFDTEVASWSPLVRGRLIDCSGTRRVPWPTNVVGTRRVPNPHTACAEYNTTCRRCGFRAGIIGSTPPVRPRRRRPRAAGARTSDAVWRAFAACPSGWNGSRLVDGRRFYNDSTATTPESTIAALAVARCAGLAPGGREEQGIRFRAVGGGNRPPGPRGGLFRIGSGGTARAGRRQGAIVSLRGGRDVGGGPAMVLAAFQAGRGDRAVARLCQHRSIPQLPASVASGSWSWFVNSCRSRRVRACTHATGFACVQARTLPSPFQSPPGRLQ